MATTKTIQPTGTTITIPAMSDRPDASVFSTDVERITDAANALNSNVETKLNNYSGTHTISLLNDTGFICLEFRNTNVTGMFTRLNIFDNGRVSLTRYANGAWQSEITLRNADS